MKDAAVKNQAKAAGADAMRALVTRLGKAARAAQPVLAGAASAQKNAALEAIAEELLREEAAILKANAKDLKGAGDLSAAMVERLTLTKERVRASAEGCRQVAKLADPVGEVSGMAFQANGLQIGKMRVPLGVVGLIYESRPSVTVDAAILCMKAGNAALLRGGSEALHSNRALVGCVHRGLAAAGLPVEAVQFIDTADRGAVGALLRSREYVDLVVPRGGKGLIERVSREAEVPILRHLDGVCHVYVDGEADLAKARAVAFNAKARRYGICGAMETLLVAEAVAGEVLPGLAGEFVEAGVELRGCARSREVAAGVAMKAAREEDWREEYLDAILAVRVVGGLEEAIAHINFYGSHHTDAIITENLTAAQRFLREVDSSSVMVNASTQFADGFEYGLGAEIGISTDKLHARGPVGLEGLTCQKFIVFGDGHVRA